MTAEPPPHEGRKVSDASIRAKNGSTVRTATCRRTPARENASRAIGKVTAITLEKDEAWCGRSTAIAEPVLTFTVTAAVIVPSSVTLLGEGVQVDSDGAPVQLMFTV